MQLNRLALDQQRLERLDAQAVQSRRAVEQHGMLADDFLENIPDLRTFPLDQPLCSLDGRSLATQLQLLENEGLEELQRHLLRQSALVQAQLRADHNDRPARVVNALAEQVLTEPALLALDHVGQRLQRALVGARDRTAATTVVQQRIDRFLKHALLVAHDDVGSIELQQAAQTVVAVDDAAIQIVEIGRRKAATIERHQRTQVRRQHGKDGQHHPLGLVARLDERLDQLQSLRQPLQLRLRRRRSHFLADLDHLLGQINGLQELEHGLGTHAGVELITVLLDRLEVHLVSQQLTSLHRRHAWVDDDEGFEVQHPLNLAQRHVQHEADTRWQRLQEPDVRSRARELDVAHALTTNLRLRNFNAALLADHAAMLETLVLAAKTFVILHGPEDLRAEESVTLGLERTVVDGLRLLHFAVGPGTDHLRRGETNLDRVKVLDRSMLLEQLQ